MVDFCTPDCYKLQNLRTGAGLSQEELAEKLSVSRQAVSKWELDKTVPDVKYIVALSDLFQVTTDYLLKETSVFTSTPVQNNPALDTESSPKPFSQNPPQRPRNNSLLTSMLLLCADLFFLLLIALRFLLRFFVSYRLSVLPPILVLLLAPVVLLISRVFLRSPAQSLTLYRHAAAGCLTLWGFSVALLVSFSEHIWKLLFEITGGHFIIPLFLSGMLLMVIISFFIFFTPPQMHQTKNNQ